MNGPRHYELAEEALVLAQEEPEASTLAPLYLAEAQVHATLAAIPPSYHAVYKSTQQRLIERLTEDHCLAAFRAAWAEADLAGKDGDRVHSGMTAAIKAALL